MKRISLEQLLRTRSSFTYEQQYNYMMRLMEAGEIKPVKASKKNGKKPALHLEYWLAEAKKDYKDLIEELKYQMHPQISVDYYLSHPEIYEQDREWVLLLDDYLKKRRVCLEHPESANERSFEIWKREKFLTREQGTRILKHCALTPKFLNIYGTTEPLAYYSHTREVPQKLLILENKDTFYSMRRHMLNGQDKILNTTIGTLIYGAGKGILRSFRDFDICVEPYMKASGNEIYYFGDLDFEGIGIYESLAKMVAGRFEICPFVVAYEAMLKKADAAGTLPDTKEKQNRNIQNIFFSYFENKQTDKMKQILEKDIYIPQEILNITDF